MNLLLDTNIILFVTKTDDFEKILKFVNPERSILYLSIVSEAEIRSFALRNKWGTKRLDYLTNLLGKCNILDVDKLLVSTYVEIDSYSQCLNPSFTSYPFGRPRNMGKNDLWIASLAAFLGLRLVTTDSDFDHLHNIFFEVRKIQPADFVPYFWDKNCSLN